MQKDNGLTTKPIPGLIAQLAIPASIGMFFNTMYNVVDTYFSGLISTEAIAALSRIEYPLDSDTRRSPTLPSRSTRTSITTVPWYPLFLAILGYLGVGFFRYKGVASRMSGTSATPALPPTTIETSSRIISSVNSELESSGSSTASVSWGSEGGDGCSMFFTISGGFKTFFAGFGLGMGLGFFFLTVFLGWTIFFDGMSGFLMTCFDFDLCGSRYVKLIVKVWGFGLLGSLL